MVVPEVTTPQANVGFTVREIAPAQSSLAGGGGGAGVVNEYTVASHPVASDPPFVGVTYQ